MSDETVKNSYQPIITDTHSTLRFKENAIVRHLLDTHPTCDLNSIAVMEFTDDDRQHFAQLIGYSLSGYSDLSYVTNDNYNIAVAMSTGLSEKDSKITALEYTVKELRQGIDELRAPLAKLLEIDLDQLQQNN